MRGSFGMYTETENLIIFFLLALGFEPAIFRLRSSCLPYFLTKPMPGHLPSLQGFAYPLYHFAPIVCKYSGT